MNERDEIERRQKQLDAIVFTGDIGTPLQAIKFAVKDTYEAGIFLEAWLQGNLNEWPEYQDFIREDNANNSLVPKTNTETDNPLEIGHEEAHY